MIRLICHSTFLKFLAEMKSDSQRLALLKTMTIPQMEVLCEILLNILRGAIKIPYSCKKKLTKYKNIIRKVTDKGVRRSTTKRLLLTIRSVLPQVIKVILPLLDNKETSDSSTESCEENDE